MSVEPMNPEAVSASKGARSESRFPSYDLADSVEVARAIHVRGGGAATPDQLASFLEYKSTNNGSFLARISAARAFGMIEKRGEVLVPTQRAHQILSPVYPQDVKAALVDAFYAIPLFKRIYEDYRGKELPSAFGMKNALRTQHGILTSRIDTAYRVLMESAETAGFFETRGAKTHLIPPLTTVAPPAAAPAAPATAPSPAANDEELVGGGGGGGREPPQDPPARPALAPQTVEEVKAKYLGALIKAFEEKASDGNLDEKLMERIERLIGAAK